MIESKLKSQKGNYRFYQVKIFGKNGESKRVKTFRLATGGVVTAWLRGLL